MSKTNFSFAAALSIALLMPLSLMPLSGHAMDRSEAPDDAAVYFIAPQNGETLTSPVTVVFGLKGMGVAPAGVE